MSDSDSRWIMGQLAAQDRYDPEEGVYQADLLRAQQPSRDPRLDPGIRRAPGDTAMRPAAQTFGEVVGNTVIPQDPLDYAAMFALGPAGKLVGKGARAGALAMGGVLGLSDEAEASKLKAIKQGIKAYHSSPHDFEKFDASKIGTGEGAQVYGHGLYFAENPAVSGQGGEYWKAFSERFKEGPEGLGVQYLKYNDMDRNAAIAALDNDLAWHQFNVKEGTVPRSVQANLEIIDKMKAARDLLESGQPVGPRTYEVNIRADPREMLDWDKPLRAQPQVFENLERNFVLPIKPEMTGQELHKSFADYLTKPRASERMAEADIPGIKYLDQGSRGWDDQIAIYERMANSRGTPQAYRDQASAELARLRANPPSSNYVVFDPNIVDIMKKYGIAGAAAPMGMGALAAQDEYR